MNGTAGITKQSCSVPTLLQAIKKQKLHVLIFKDARGRKALKLSSVQLYKLHARQTDL